MPLCGGSGRLLSHERRSVSVLKTYSRLMRKTDPSGASAFSQLAFFPDTQAPLKAELDSAFRANKGAVAGA